MEAVSKFRSSALYDKHFTDWLTSSGLFNSEIQQHGRMANMIVTGQESSVRVQTERQRSRGWQAEQREVSHTKVRVRGKEISSEDLDWLPASLASFVTLVSEHLMLSGL